MRKWMAMILAFVWLLSGCAAQNPTSNANIPGTMDDPFAPTSQTAATIPTNNSIDLGSRTFSIPAEYRQRDEMGHYIAYEGGVLHLAFEMEAMGTISSYDVGILLFIDGVAQPYRVEPDGEYTYMHSFSQKDGTQKLGVTTTVVDVYFTPIIGEDGDMLEFYALSILNPEYLPSQGFDALAGTFGGLTYETRLKYNTAPSEDTFPERSTRLLNVSTSRVDCTPEDVVDWTERDMILKTRNKFRVIGTGENWKYAYGVREDEPLTLRYEVWGSPYVHYGLIFFVDNEPVCTADMSDIWVTVEMGQKTVIEATLDMTGFSGESAVYAVLVPRNYRTSEIETCAYFTEGPTIYLLAEEKDA